MSSIMSNLIKNKEKNATNFILAYKTFGIMTNARFVDDDGVIKNARKAGYVNLLGAINRLSDTEAAITGKLNNVTPNGYLSKEDNDKLTDQGRHDINCECCKKQRERQMSYVFKATDDITLVRKKNDKNHIYYDTMRTEDYEKARVNGRDCGQRVASYAKGQEFQVGGDCAEDVTGFSRSALDSVFDDEDKDNAKGHRQHLDRVGVSSEGFIKNVIAISEYFAMSGKYKLGNAIDRTIVPKHDIKFDNLDHEKLKDFGIDLDDYSDAMDDDLNFAVNDENLDNLTYRVSTLFGTDKAMYSKDDVLTYLAKRAYFADADYDHTGLNPQDLFKSLAGHLCDIKTDENDRKQSYAFATAVMDTFPFDKEYQAILHSDLVQQRYDEFMNYLGDDSLLQKNVDNLRLNDIRNLDDTIACSALDSVVKSYKIFCCSNELAKNKGYDYSYSIQPFNMDDSIKIKRDLHSKGREFSDKLSEQGYPVYAYDTSFDAYREVMVDGHIACNKSSISYDSFKAHRLGDKDVYDKALFDALADSISDSNPDKEDLRRIINRCQVEQLMTIGQMACYVECDMTPNGAIMRGFLKNPNDALKLTALSDDLIHDVLDNDLGYDEEILQQRMVRDSDVGLRDYQMIASYPTDTKEDLENIEQHKKMITKYADGVKKAQDQIERFGDQLTAADKNLLENLRDFKEEHMSASASALDVVNTYLDHGIKEENAKEQADKFKEPKSILIGNNHIQPSKKRDDECVVITSSMTFSKNNNIFIVPKKNVVSNHNGTSTILLDDKVGVLEKDNFGDYHRTCKTYAEKFDILNTAMSQSKNRLTYNTDIQLSKVNTKNVEPLKTDRHKALDNIQNNAGLKYQLANQYSAYEGIQICKEDAEKYMSACCREFEIGLQDCHTREAVDDFTKACKDVPLADFMDKIDYHADDFMLVGERLVDIEKETRAIDEHNKEINRQNHQRLTFKDKLKEQIDKNASFAANRSDAEKVRSMV